MKCIKCGGDMLGDGFSTVLRCEYAEEEQYEYSEPDANPVWCEYTADTYTDWRGRVYKINEKGEYV